MAFNQPKAYLITFTCYGTRLHGDDRGTVDDDHNIHGTPVLPTNHDQQDVALRRMNHGRVLLDAPMRTVVDRTIRGSAITAGGTCLKSTCGLTTFMSS